MNKIEETINIDDEIKEITELRDKEKLFSDGWNVRNNYLKWVKKIKWGRENKDNKED